MLAESTPSGAVLGFYTREDLPGYHRLADEYVLFDHFFQAMSGGSTGNALYLVAGRSARWSSPPKGRIGSLDPPLFDRPYDRHGVLINDAPPVNGPTETFMGPLALCPPPDQQTFPNVGDRLDAAGLSWAWYNEGWNAVKAVGAEDGFRRRRRLRNRRYARDLSAPPQSVPIFPELVQQRQSGTRARQRRRSRRPEEKSPAERQLSEGNRRPRRASRELGAAVGRAVGPRPAEGARRMPAHTTC